MSKHHFLCYSTADALEFALKLHDALEAGPPPIPAWMDKHDLRPGADWDDQVPEALRACETLLFAMTRDSVAPGSVCKNEWTTALRYKKAIVPLLVAPGVEMPFGLGNRQHIDFTGDFATGLAKLRQHLTWLASPEGVLRTMQDRLADAQRAQRRASDPQQLLRIQDDIADLERQIAAQERVVSDPEGVAREVEQRIASGLERERQPQQRPSGEERPRFINPPPGAAPDYFQDRFDETKRLGHFLRDASQRMIVVVGRGGVGKTTAVCRLLKAVENGRLPDDGGPMRVDGIVYLSENGSRRVNFPHLFEDLCKLAPEAEAARLRELAKDAKLPAEAKMRALLQALPQGCIVLLLDNFEDVLDGETRDLKDAELGEALRALLNVPHHAVKVIITTRLAPRELLLVQPGRQQLMELDKGLDSPYAENLLREMDTDGKLGLRDAADGLLRQARERTMGNPRALEALKAILAADRDATLAEVLAATERLPQNVTEALVGEAFNRLDPAAQLVMQALAVYARPVSPAAVDYLLQPHLPGINSAAVLSRLVGMHFARKEAGKYYLHPVDRAYAASRIPEGAAHDRYPYIARPAAPRVPDGKACQVMGFQTAPLTQYALRHRGAEYFRQARTPRSQWKTLDDLEPQLSEFELRFAGADYDSAAEVLGEITFDYLLLWGHARLAAELHERLLPQLRTPRLRGGRLGVLGLAYSHLGRHHDAIDRLNEALSIACDLEDHWAEGAWLGNLGNCCSDLGQTARAIEYHEQALAIAREIGNRRSEGTQLGNLGNRYSDLGQTTRAIEYYEQALAISREIGDRLGEAIHPGNLGICFGDLGQTMRAIEYFEQALAISRELGYREGESRQLDNCACVAIQECKYSDGVDLARRSVAVGEEIANPEIVAGHRGSLSLALLYLGELSNARAEIAPGRCLDVPLQNPRVAALHGVIALHQRDVAVAREAFADAVRHADLLLERCAQNYRALDTKGLALCGLALCDPALCSERATAEDDPSSHVADLVVAAADCFRRARQINMDAGYLLMHLRLLDKLAECDPDGRLRPARAAASSP